MRIDDYSVAWYAGMNVVQKHDLVCIYVDFKSLYVNVLREVHPMCQKWMIRGSIL